VKKALIIRYGAFGDMIITTPVIRELKKQGYFIYMNTNRRGLEVLQGNPHVDQYVPYEDDSVKFEQMEDFWQELYKNLGCDKYVNLTQSLEVKLAMHPATKEYYQHPDIIKERCNKNYYEESLKIAELETDNYLPEMFFTELEENSARQYLKKGHYNILWCLKGSGVHKFYPWTQFIIDELYAQCPNINVITVGDWRAKDIEDEIDKRATKLVNKIPFRVSSVLSKLSDLVVSTDTGILHAAGCWDTPKIALLGATNKENITKHFKNCITLQADVPCSPCFSLIYEHEKQGCPIDEVTNNVICMGAGIDPKQVFRIIMIKYSDWSNILTKGIMGGLCYGNKNVYNGKRNRRG
jgi:ADP-heptose:LPS heptosyltransferase